MSKRTYFTTVTPLPAGITRETVLSTLHSHTEMIDLNPLVIERHPIRPPPDATPEEAHCSWYSISDKINYVPGIYTGNLTFHACFHDLPDGLQSHIYAPMGLDMKGRWTLGGSLPGEPRQPVEIGLGMPKQGLWLREDVNMKCNVVMTGFVKKTTKKAHHTLVDRLVEKAHIKEAEDYNNGLKEQLELRSQYPPDYHAGIASPVPAASATYLDGKPSAMQHSPSISDAGSIKSSGAGACGGGGGGWGSVHNSRHSYGQAHPQVPIEHQYQSYQPAPAYAAPAPAQMPMHMQQQQQRPGAVPRNSHPPSVPPQVPYTAELPTQEPMPVELESNHQRSYR